MKETFKNNIKITLLSVAFIVIVVVGFLLNIFFGNPFSKKNAEKQIKIYLEDTYGFNEYVVFAPEYDLETMAYYTFVTSPTSEDTQFEVSYGNNKIIDTYSTFVESRENTWTRLHDTFNSVVTSVFEKRYSVDIFIAGLGRDSTEAEIKALALDSPLDLENLMLDSYAMIYILSEDRDWESLAKALWEIDQYLLGEKIKIDYYDIALEPPKGTQNTESVGVYDFSRELIQEENLPQIMQEHYENWIKSQKTD